MDLWHAAWVIPADRGRRLAEALARDRVPPAVDAVATLLAEVRWDEEDERVEVPLDADTRARLAAAAARLGVTVTPRDPISPWVARGLDELPRYERLVALGAPEVVVAGSAEVLHEALARAEGRPVALAGDRCAEDIARFRDLRGRCRWWLFGQELPDDLAGVDPYQDGVRFGPAAPAGEGDDVRSTLRYLWNQVRLGAIGLAVGWRPDIGLGADVPLDWPELGLQTEVDDGRAGPGDLVLAPTFPDGEAEVVSVATLREAAAAFRIEAESGCEDEAADAERAIAAFREALAQAPDDAWVACWIGMEG